MSFSRVVFPGPRVVEVEQLDESALAAPAAGELVVQARSSLVSTGTESFCLAGDFDDDTFWAEWVQYPFEPGYSMCGTVERVGPGTPGFSVGDRVAASSPHRGLAVVDATEAVVVPAGVTDEQATWASLASTTQLGVRRADPALGETAVVVGLGLLGQLVTRYLRLRGLRHVVAVDTSQARLERALAGGATAVLPMSCEGAVEPLRELLDGSLADVAFDVTGSARALAPTTRLVRPSGRVVLLGDCPTPSRQVLGPRVVGDSLTVIGVHASSGREPWTTPAMVGLFFDYLQDGRMQVDDLVTHRVTPADAPAVYADLLRDRSAHLGVLLEWPR